MARPKSYINEKNLLKLIDILLEMPTYAVAAKAIGISQRQIFEWRSKSIAAMKANDTSSPFWIEHRNSWDWWHNQCGKSRIENLMIAEAKIRQEAVDGILEPCFGPDQRPLFLERPETIGRSDDWIREHDGLGDWEEVDRLLRDSNGHPIQQTKRTHIPAPLRKAVLAASHPDYREQSTLSVEHSGVVHVSKAMERLANEPRPGFEELRALALMSPAERRAKLGAKPAPVNAAGLVIPADLGTPKGDNRSDHVREQQPVAPPPNPRAYEAPLRLMPPTPKPYAKPVRSLDSAGRGRGTPPEGGGPANAPGNVR